MNRIKVMIVDDSAVVRQVLSKAVQQAPDMELMGAVQDPIFAMARLSLGWPDVIVLDIEMPRMDGLTFLRKLMAEHPTPVIICSTLTERGAQITVEALSAGAAGFITKAKIGVKDFLEDAAGGLLDSIRSAARINPARLRHGTARVVSTPKLSADAMLPPPATSALHETTEKVVAIGTSTGGTQALEEILTNLTREAPGVVVVQHMPERFTAAFADRLNGLCQIEVKEAADGDRVLPGRSLIAPGGRHMMLRRSGAQYFVEVKEGPLVNRHRPSVDVLFRSVAKIAARNALGIILTGMGDDGAAGMLEMHDAGALTLAETEETCVVYGMPKEAVKRGGVDRSLPLPQFARAIHEYGQGRLRK